PPPRRRKWVWLACGLPFAGSAPNRSRAGNGIGVSADGRFTHVHSVTVTAGAPAIKRPSVPTQKFVVAPRAPLRPPGQARRRSRIMEIRRGGATPTGGMQRRPNANELLGRDTRPEPRSALACISAASCPERRLA